MLKEKGYSLGYIGKWHLDNPQAPFIDCANNKGEPKWGDYYRENIKNYYAMTTGVDDQFGRILKALKDEGLEEEGLEEETIVVFLSDSSRSDGISRGYT